MASKRVFSEKEAAEIMQRAVRLQESSSSGKDYTPGVTAEELKKIAIEAGIDESFIDKAITGIDVEDKSETGPFNLTEEFTRVVEGEISPDDFDKILNLFSHSQKNGLKQVGRTLSGPAIRGIHMTSLNVESRKGRTKVNVKYLPVFAYLIGLHGPLISAAILLASQIEAGRPWLGAGLAAGLLTIGGIVFKALVNAGRKAAKKLTGEIVDVVEEETTLRDNLSHAGSGREEERERIEEKA